MTKKIVSLFIAICLIIGSLPAMAQSTVKNVTTTQAVEILQALGMINEDYDKMTIEADKNISKAEFADIAADVFANGRTSGGKLYFHDVPKSHWAYESIATLVDEGMLAIGEDRKFYPDNIMTRNEAAEFVLRTLGYQPYIERAEVLGTSVERLAAKIDLFKGVSTSSELTFADMIRMFYNGLLSEVIEISAVNSGTDIKYKGSGLTYLEKNYSIYMESGILEGYDGISINSNSVNEKEAVIEGVRFNSEIDLSSLIGSKVSYLFKYEKGSEQRNIIWVSEDEKSKALDLLGYENDVYFDADNYRIEYTPDGSSSTKKIKLSKALKLVYNGELVSSGVEDVLSSDFYSIKLIENNGTYDTAVIWAYENYSVNGVDKENEGFYDKLSKGYVSLKGLDRVDIYSEGGLKISLSDIKTGNILSVYKSLSGQRIKIVCSQSNVTGVVAKLDTREGYNRITIDGTQYRTAKTVDGQLVSTGDNVILYLDENGYVADVEFGAGKSVYAYLIKAYLDDSKSHLYVKMFDQTGKMEELECAKSLKIDGNKYRTASEALSILGGGALKPQLIVYDKNSDGYLSNIDRASTVMSERESSDSLYLRFEESSQAYRNVGKLGRKMYVGANTVIFGIPDDPQNATDDEFIVRSKANLSADQKYLVASYATSDKVEYEEVLVIKGNDWYEQLDKAGVLIESIYESSNADDEVVKCIEGYQGASKVQLLCTTDYSQRAASLKPGDFIQYSSDKNGNLKSASVVYSIGMEEDKRPKATEHYQRNVITTGYIHSVTGTMAAFGLNSGADFDDTLYFGTTTVLVYDSANEEISVGSVDDLVAYDVAGDACSFVLADLRYSAPRAFVIYK